MEHRKLKAFSAKGDLTQARPSEADGPYQAVKGIAEPATRGSGTAPTTSVADNCPGGSRRTGGGEAHPGEYGSGTGGFPAFERHRLFAVAAPVVPPTEVDLEIVHRQQTTQCAYRST